MSRNYYTSKEVKPRGWLQRQLEIQAAGLSGNLDKVWRDIKDSAWIGGEAEGWERVPYWLDGFIPLAYLLENDDMIARAKKYIDAILSYQKPDGWICPCKQSEIPTYDTWAVQLISKVLVVYYQCSADERIPEVLYRVMKNYYSLLKEGTVRLFEWGRYRWYEAFIAIKFLKDRYDEPWLTELAKILKEQGADYSTLTDLWKRPINRWVFGTHIVNLVMMLKSEALCTEVLGDEYTDLAEKLSSVLKEYNGTPVGLFTGDECLSGLSAIQGTELCAVAEQMFSYELLYLYTGEAKWAERLEVIAFNALPASISDDMWSHQYVQMSNQIACCTFPGRSLFRTNGPEAHIFGLEPHFGCCTSNFNQAWPKLALSAFIRTDSGIESALAVPCSLSCEEADISVESEYPFKNRMTYTVNAKKALRFDIRIPSFAENLTVNGSKVEKLPTLTFDISAGETKEIEVSFDTVPTVTERPHGLKTVTAGSLVFSIPISYKKEMKEYVKNGIERKYPYCDYEYIPVSDWNYALSSDKLSVNEEQIYAIPFSSENPPITVTAKVKPIRWGLEDGFETVCAKIPESLEPIGDELEIKLYPYGCAKLRITELPLI